MTEDLDPHRKDFKRRLFGHLGNVSECGALPTFKAIVLATFKAGGVEGLDDFTFARYSEALPYHERTWEDVETSIQALQDDAGYKLGKNLEYDKREPLR